MANALFSIPFALTLRNFVPTGLASQISTQLGVQVHLASPFVDSAFLATDGRSFSNHCIPSAPGPGGVPNPRSLTSLDSLLKSIHLTGFAIEYPDGSLQNIILSERHNAQWYVARTLTAIAPRSTKRRQALRQLYARYRPRRQEIVALFDQVQPEFLLTASPGHFWLDHILLDEAARRGIPTFCVILSWDNLYSRGPLCRRPDYLLVWSDEMKRQASIVHQFPVDNIAVVGALQFVFYEKPVTGDEVQQMRRRVGLGKDDPFLAYVCGARTSEYDVEDILVLIDQIKNGPFRNLRVVVRPHPQGARASYVPLKSHGVLIDDSLDIVGEDARPDSFNYPAIRHMASLLKSAQFVVSSWGTTALLEACIFDTPSVQLRWMDSVPHANHNETQMVREFQRYIHMRAFDMTGARIYCDEPQQINDILLQLQSHKDDYGTKRKIAVEHLVKLPLDGVVERASLAIAMMLSRRAELTSSAT